MAVMEPFATRTDMENRSRGAITATSHPFLDLELEAATRTIVNECGWHVAPRRALTYRRVWPTFRDVWLPAMQIQEITAATLDDTVVTDLDEIEFDPDTGWTNINARKVLIEYRAGFSPVPEDLVTLTLEIAAAALGTSLGISEERAGGVSVKYARAGGALIEADRSRLWPYQLGRLP